LLERFHIAWLRAQHVERRAIANSEVLIKVAAEVGLDVDKVPAGPVE
jgi:predicted DsbA family dithiol-disulfide isomerase